MERRNRSAPLPVSRTAQNATASEGRMPKLHARLFGAPVRNIYTATELGVVITASSN